MYNKESNCRDEERQIKEKGTFVKLMPIANVIYSFNSGKLSKFLVSNCRGNSRMSSRTLASSNTFSTMDTKSTQLTLMDIPAMVPARGWSSEGINLLGWNSITKSSYRHGVASLNLLNILPTNQVSTKGVNNFYCLIKKDHLWVDKNLKAHRANPCAPKRSGNKTEIKSIINQLQVKRNKYSGKAHAAKEESTSWPKVFSVTHQGIFSCIQLRQVA